MQPQARYASRMDEKRGAGGRPKGVRYPKRLMVYTTEQGFTLLDAIASRWETSHAEAMRRLIREKAKDMGLGNEDPKD